MTAQSVLVTGGAGYIGSHVILALREKGHGVVVIDDLSTGFREAVPAGVAFQQGSVADADLVGSLLRRHAIGAVIHLAASVSAPQSMNRPLLYHENNTQASVTLAQTCLAHGVERFIYASSASVYGDEAASPIGEDAPKRPISPYGGSKLAAETLLGDLASAHARFRLLCLRYFNVGGADPGGRTGERNPDAAGLIPLAVKAVLGDRESLDIRGDDYATRDGTPERDYVHVADLARLHAAALDYMDGGGACATLNCGTGAGHTVLEVVAALETLTGRRLPTRREPRRPGDPAKAVADVTRLRRTLDWRASADSLPSILRTSLAWHSARRGSAP